MFTLINDHSVGRLTPRGPLSLFILFPVPPQHASCFFFCSKMMKTLLPLLPSTPSFASCQVLYSKFLGAGTWLGGSCLISRGFNYLHWPPLGRSEGLRVNERRIDSEHNDQVSMTLQGSPLPPTPLFALSQSGGRSVRAHKVKPVRTAVCSPRETGSSLGNGEP